MNYQLIGILLGIGLLIALLTDIHTNRVLARQHARSKASVQQLTALLEDFMNNLEDVQVDFELKLEELDKLNADKQKAEDRKKS